MPDPTVAAAWDRATAAANKLLKSMGAAPPSHLAGLLRRSLDHEAPPTAAWLEAAFAADPVFAAWAKPAATKAVAELRAAIDAQAAAVVADALRADAADYDTLRRRLVQRHRRVRRTLTDRATQLRDLESAVADRLLKGPTPDGQARD